MRNRNDYINVFLLTMIMFIAAAMQVNAASSVIYKEELRTYTDRGYVGVGHFEVGGKTAFCMEHANASPPTGTEVTSKVYSDDKIRKILYYGWEGPGQWSGFSGYKQGITLTSLLLSETYTTAHPVGTYNFVDGLSRFRDFVNSQPMPDLDLKFNKTSVSAYYDKALDAERTEDITVVGNGTGKLTVNIPKGFTLHNNKTGSESTGSVTLGPNDSFYLRTEGTYSEVKSTEIKGRNAKLQPIVFVTESTSLQDLTRLEVAEDSADTTKLTVKWIGKLDLRIIKSDADTSQKLGGAKFVVYQIDDKGNKVSSTEKTVESSADGEAIIKEYLQCGRKYRVEETKAPHAYKLNSEPKIIDVTGENLKPEVAFENEKQFVYINVNKLGMVYRIANGRIESSNEPLEGAVFEVRAAEDIYNWGGTSVLYANNQVVSQLATDSEGKAVTEGLPPGRYSIAENKTLDGFILDREVKTYNLEIEETESELNYTATYVNKAKETALTIIKRDKDTEKPLRNARFKIENSKGESIEVRTDSDGKSVIKNLPTGEYTLTEVEAPRGYELETKSQHFSIEYEGENATVELVAYNKKKTAPITGDFSSNSFKVYVGFLVISAIGVIYTTRIRKRMKKH